MLAWISYQHRRLRDTYRDDEPTDALGPGTSPCNCGS